jgi:hypothetical protein
MKEGSVFLFGWEEFFAGFGLIMTIFVTGKKLLPEEEPPLL